MNTYSIGDIIIGEYNVLDIFGGKGKSGMGIVYLVTCNDFQYPFVLKTFQKADQNSISRFRLEAETWVSIGINPYIVNAHFVREINNQLFIGAEYIKPDCLGRNSVSGYLYLGDISIYNIIKWTAQFCFGMDFALERGMKVHRDIKPDNLMIDDEGNLKITDFGLVKAEYNYENKKHLPNENINLTSASSFLGTIMYASPEQILDSSKIDFRSDIYSFGIVLYQLISAGEYPYSLKGKTTIEELAIMHLSSQLIEIDHPLFSLASKCLSRDTKNRYASYGELLYDLQKSAKELNIKIPTNTYNKDDRVKEYYMQSYSLLSLGEYSKALEKINECLIIDNSESSSLSLKGSILLETGNVKEALKYTLLSNDVNPYNSKTLNNIGIIYGRLGEVYNAIKYLEKSIEVDPQNSGALMNLAIQYENNGNVGPACSCTIKALNIAPDKKDLLFNASNIAAFAAKNREFNKAIQILEILIKIDEENTNNWFNLALYYAHTNQKENAVNCFLYLAKVLPTDEEVLTFLTRLLGELDRYDEALIYCEKMLENNIAILKAVSFKAQLLQSKGCTKEAIKFIKTVLVNNSENENLWMLLSDLYGNDKDYKNGLFYAEKARKVILLQGKKINNDNLSYIEQRISSYKRYGSN